MQWQDKLYPQQTTPGLHPGPSARLGPGLGERHWTLLELIAEHGALHTRQVTELMFSSRPTASRHLSALTRAGLVRRMVYDSDPSHQAHYELSAEGTQALAEHLHRNGRPVPVAPGTLINDHALVTAFRVGLTTTARECSTSSLYQWRPALDTVAWLDTYGIPHVDPRAYGVWIEDGAAVKLLLHVDYGQPDRLSGAPAPPPSQALAGYRTAGKGVPATAILVVFSVGGREPALLGELADRPLGVAVASTTTGRLRAASSPADAIWMVAGSTVKVPVRLVDVARRQP